LQGPCSSRPWGTTCLRHQQLLAACSRLGELWVPLNGSVCRHVVFEWFCAYWGSGLPLQGLSLGAVCTCITAFVPCTGAGPGSVLHCSKAGCLLQCSAVHMYPICSSAALLRHTGISLWSGVFGEQEPKEPSSRAAAQLPVVPYGIGSLGCFLLVSFLLLVPVSGYAMALICGLTADWLSQSAVASSFCRRAAYVEKNNCNSVL
jgi:hypothetical protein